VLHLSTRRSFGSIRKLALSSIEPPTPHDRLLLARTHSVDGWVVPALSALCERTTPLTLSEARQMNVEDIVLVSTVREHIRGRTIQVDVQIPLRVEAEQLISLSPRTPLSPSCESEDDAPMAGAWHSRSRWEKAEAEARARAQEATGLRPDAEAKKLAERDEKACQEAEKASPEAEETQKGAVEKARLVAEEARKDEEEKARLETEKARKDAEGMARLEAEKAHKDAEEKARAAKALRKAKIVAKKCEAKAKAKADAKAKAAKTEASR